MPALPPVITTVCISSLSARRPSGNVPRGGKFRQHHRWELRRVLGRGPAPLGDPQRRPPATKRRPARSFGMRLVVLAALSLCLEVPAALAADPRLVALGR